MKWVGVAAIGLAMDQRTRDELHSTLHPVCDAMEAS